MNAIRSSVNTSSRCAGNSLSAIDSKNQSYPEKGDYSDRFQIAVAFSAITIIGPGILLLINEIFQTFFNEPKKREEQLEIACHVASGNVRTGDDDTEPRSLEFELSNGAEIKFTERANGVHIQHDNGESKLVFDKFGNSFKTLNELQKFRRKDISDNKTEYEEFFSNGALKDFFGKARLISVLSTTNIDAKSTVVEDRIINDLKKIYQLTDERIKRAFDLIKDALIHKTGTPQTYTGLDLLRLAAQPLFALEKNLRDDPDSDMWFETPHSIYNLTNAGEEKIAAHYNKKYFLSKKDNKKIIVTKNDADFENKLKSAISDESCRMAGFLFRVNPSPDAHPTPIVFEKKNGEFHFFISDSMVFIAGQYRAVIETLKAYPQVKAKIHISSASASNVSRQADNGSCHSDALYYLQRALRLGSMCDQVTFTPASNPDAEYDVFTEPADLLLTAQTSRALKENKVELNSRLKLGKLDKPKTFENKTSNYNRAVEYSEIGNPSIKKEFNTKGFLSHVNQKHHSILMTEDYV